MVWYPGGMELYIRPGCGYCTKVLDEARRLGVQFVLHDISDPQVAQELLARGGKQQVPYLVDVARAVEMYESDDIIAHLQKWAA